MDRHPILGCLAPRVGLLAFASFSFVSVSLAQLIYQEGFNSDGTQSVPPRYTITDGMKYEPPFAAGNDPGIPDTQLGPVFWAHSFEVSFVGVPGPTKGRRAMMAWDGAISDSDVTAETWKLIDATVKWLAHDKANATILFTPNQSGSQSLADHFAAAGYTVLDDDESVAEASVTADVIIRAPGGANVSRFAQSDKGVLVYSSSDHDDMLTSSIGSTATFESGVGTVVSTHPAAGGVTGTFTVATGSHNWNLLGDVLPTGAIPIATLVREIPPTAASLADVDAMVSGSKPSDKATGTVSAVDFSDNSSGDYQVDNPIPGGAAGVFGLVTKGKLRVATAGKYSFAVASDDGARLRVDLDKNGVTASDNVLVNDTAQGHTPKYADVTFAAAGDYDFELTTFNSGGNGDVEFSVSTQSNGGDTSAISSGSWELLGQTSSAGVSLVGDASATSYVPSGASEKQTLPFLVINNGPQDLPPGNVFGGGPFVGYEGSGFFGGSALNKANIPTEGLSDDFGPYRSVRLRGVDVTGKTNVKVTVALAGTFLDFETNDRLDIMAYPDGENSTPVRLARFTAPTGSVKYFADVDHGNQPRLGLTFQDVTYNAPAGAKNLIIEFRGHSTWWNETMGFDNVRISAGSVTPPLGAVAAAVNGSDLQLSWTGGTPPYLVQGKLALTDPNWIDLETVNTTSANIPMAALGGVFRVQDGATKTVKLFKAVLNGANERPTPNNEVGTGIGLLALDGLSLTYVVSYQNLTATPHLFHLHGLAGTDATAGVKIALVPAGSLGRSGLFVGQATVDAATADGIAQSQTYFNVHTPGKYGAGEIRGQVVPQP